MTTLHLKISMRGAAEDTILNSNQVHSFLHRVIDLWIENGQYRIRHGLPFGHLSIEVTEEPNDDNE